MEILLSDELRLVYVLILNGALLAAAWRFCRRWTGGDWIDRTADSLLLAFAIQYVSVCVPGVIGVLNFWSIALVALGLSAGLWWGAGGRQTVTSQNSAVYREARGDVRSTQAGSQKLAQSPFLPVDWEGWIAGACLLFVAGYLAAIVYMSFFVPTIATDPLVYHLPAAVHWLQQGRISLFEIWPQVISSYSPLGGSVFIAWLMAPMGNDVLARFVQIPPLLLLFLMLVRLTRSLGVKTAAAALVATSVVLGRAVVSQGSLPKDDLFVSAFFVSAVVGLARPHVSERLGAWRLGLALGLLLTIKYTVLMSLPVLALMLDAPWRAGWRTKDWAAAAMLSLVLAGPWYLRNWVLTGNPLFPVDIKVGGAMLLPGLYTIQRSVELSHWGAIRESLLGRYYSPPQWLVISLGMAWATSLLLGFRPLIRQPLMRICLIGAPLGVVLFLARSMYAEVRYVYPSLLLLSACVAIVLGRVMPRGWMQALPALVLAIASAATAFLRPVVYDLMLAGAAAAAGGLLLIWLQRAVLHLHPKRIGLIGLSTATLLGMWVYVYWHAHLRSYEATVADVWKQPQHYDALGAGWEFVRRDTPPDAIIACANTTLTYPLQGFGQRRRVRYVSMRRDIPTFLQIPRLADVLSGEEALRRANAVLQAEPDRKVWLERLRASGARYLFVVKGRAARGTGMVECPVELMLADADPGQFARVFENEAASVYELRVEQGR